MYMTKHMNENMMVKYVMVQINVKVIAAIQLWTRQYEHS